MIIGTVIGAVIGAVLTYKAIEYVCSIDDELPRE